MERSERFVLGRGVGGKGGHPLRGVEVIGGEGVLGTTARVQYCAARGY